MTLVKRNRDDQQHGNAFDLQNNTYLYQNLPRIFDKSKLQNCPYDDKIQRLALGLSQARNRTGHWTKTSQFEFISNIGIPSSRAKINNMQLYSIGCLKVKIIDLTVYCIA